MPLKPRNLKPTPTPRCYIFKQSERAAALRELDHLKPTGGLKKAARPGPPSATRASAALADWASAATPSRAQLSHTLPMPSLASSKANAMPITASTFYLEDVKHLIPDDPRKAMRAAAPAAAPPRDSSEEPPPPTSPFAAIAARMGLELRPFYEDPDQRLDREYSKQAAAKPPRRPSPHPPRRLLRRRATRSAATAGWLVAAPALAWTRRAISLRTSFSDSSRAAKASFAIWRAAPAERDTLLVLSCRWGFSL